MKILLEKNRWLNVTGFPGLGGGQPLAISLLNKRRVYGKVSTDMPSQISDWIQLQRTSVGIVVGGVGEYWIYTTDSDAAIDVTVATTAQLMDTANYVLFDDADRLTTLQRLRFTGDIAGQGDLLGGLATINMSLPTKLVGGEYTVVTVNDKGQVVSARPLTADDIPSGIDASKITGTISVESSGNTATASKLLTARSITASGDASWAVNFDGSANATAALTLANTGIAAGRYIGLNIDAKGRALSGSPLVEADIPALSASKITSGTLSLSTTGNAATATKLATVRAISLTGDGTWTVNFDGSAAATAALTLSNTGVTAGNYTKVTVDVKGRITAGTNPTTLLGYGITDAVNVSLVGAANGLATLGSDGKLPVAQLPAIAITDTFVVADQAAMLALVAQRGDVAVRSDLNKSFILKSESPTTLADWIELKTPTDAVLTVNGQTGVVSVTTITGNAGTATALQTVRTISATGDATWTVNFNGTANATAAITLSSTGVSAGSYTKVTVDAKGRVTAGTNPTTLSGYGITDACPLNSTASVVTVGTLNVGSGVLTITGGGNNNIELGRVDGIASTPFIDFHSGATLCDYDARIMASSGDGIAGHGSLTVYGSNFTVVGLLTAQSGVIGNASTATTLKRVFNCTNTGSTYVNQYTKILSIVLTSQYQDYTSEITAMSTASGDVANYVSKLLIRVKQQGAFGTNPYVDCQQFSQTTTDPHRYHYVIVRNTPTTIVDIYAYIPIQWSTLNGFLQNENFNAGTGTGYLANQAFVATMPGSPVAFVKDGGGTPGVYQNVTLGEGGRVVNGTNALSNFAIGSLPAGQVGARYWIGAISAEAHYVGDRYVFKLQPRNWSALNGLSKTGLTAGSTCRVIDLGMQEFLYDGTVWRPTAGRLLLANVSWDGVTPTGSLTGVTSGAFFTAGNNVKIPAGLISRGASVHAEILFRHIGTGGTATAYLGLSTYDSTAAIGKSAAVGVTLAINDLYDVRVNSVAYFNGAVTNGFTTAGWLSLGGGGVSSFSYKSTDINTAADMYLVPYINNANVADTIVIYAYRYWIEF